MLRTLVIKNKKKREVALKNEAGGDDKHLFFYLALFLSKNFVARMFSMERNNKYIIVSKTFLENQAENTVVLFQKSYFEWNLYSVKSIDYLADSHLSFAYIARVLSSMILGIW